MYRTNQKTRGAVDDSADETHIDIRSPQAITLFRSAFAGNTDAWAALHTSYTPLMQYWIVRQYLVDPEEIIQEAWLAFARYAPCRPSLVEPESLGPVLAYLRTCVKTTLISRYRQEQRCVMTVREGNIGTEMSSTTMDNSIVRRIILQERVNKLVNSEDERIIFQLRFVDGMKPQSIVAAHPDRFPDARIVYTLVQRLVQRLRRDSILWELQMSA
ncbi:MAG: sigma-70 family RNA polymerase sigma factor [Chloroflexota bacterium]